MSDDSSLWQTNAEDTVLHAHFGGLVEALEWAAALIDLLAIALLLIGAGRFLAGYIRAEFTRDGADRLRRMNHERVELGRYILTGLEVFIVSDIIHTALSLSLADLAFLGLLVLIRSVTSFFLDRELEQLKKELGEA